LNNKLLMIDYLIGVDGGGTGTRVRIARMKGDELAQAQGGPSGLALGIDKAWQTIGETVAKAFAQVGISPAPIGDAAIGLGLAGVHNKVWAAAFEAANPGYAALRLETDGYTTLMGAHQGRAGTIVAIGTGSVGQAVIDACGGHRDAIQAWLGSASQTNYAQLAPLVIAHAATDHNAHAMLAEAGREAAAIAQALDPTGTLPLALCGGLGAALRPYLPAALLTRSISPSGDAAQGALRMIELHLKEPGRC
jgi:glucosamine kinase